jgi:histidyl-tRNA synthetase
VKGEGKNKIKMKYKSIKGTKDILPAFTPDWQRIEETSRKIFGLFGYREIRTPIIEEAALFTKSVGEDTDIVKKEMFSFTDRGQRNISLRPEGTAPIVRAYLENNLEKKEPFQKLYYIGPMFRAERPQAGRMRQFHQIGVEAIGSNSPALDAEVISAMIKLLDACGIKNYKLKLNNLGCRDDKKKLSRVLKGIFSDKTNQKLLCEDCKRRAKTNPMRILDCKVESCKAVVREQFKRSDFLCEDCKLHFTDVVRYLKLLKIPYAVDPFIVRGLDYYTRTVFEVTCGELGAQNAIAAGGRYDNLISDMGGPEAGACGFALGFERMMMVSDIQKNSPMRQLAPMNVFVATLGAAANEKGFTLLEELRSAGISADIDYGKGSLKSQMRAADSLGAAFVLIIGDDELTKGEAVLRDMKTKEQVSIKFEDIVQKIIALVNVK